MNTLVPQHHPDQNLLTEFVTGALEYAPAIAVSAHLHYCARCRSEVKRLEDIGGTLLSSLSSTLISVNDDTNTENNTTNDDAFAALMKKIDASNETDSSPETHTQQPTPIFQGLTTTEIAPNKISAKLEGLPSSVQKMLSTQPVKWKRVTKNLKSASLAAGQNKYGVSLQKIQAGGRVPEHDHRGSEMTVVLRGSFSDEDNVYQQGDFLLKQVGDKHQPIASNNQDCLCLSVESAPVKLTSIWGRILNPFLRIHAA